MGKLYVVATPIGNLNDMTKRAIEVLENVDIILCEDTRHSLKLLNHYHIKKRLISYHKFNEEQRTKEIIEKLENNDIALITDAGTPCISDPGYILVKEAKEKNFEVLGVGGISAVITALSVSGINTDHFTFLGFFPRTTKEKLEFINKMKDSKVTTFIIYESPKRIIKTLEFLKENIEIKKVSVSSDLTKLHEKNYFGEIEKVLKELKENEKSDLGEYTIVIEITPKKEQKVNELSLEARLIDTMIKNNISLKESINLLNNKEIPKKEIYNASLKLKELLNKNDW